MKVGYARVSTADQCLDMQRDKLCEVGCDKIFEETMTGTSRRRPALDRALRSLKAGDVLVVWKLDRLGRSLQHLIEILKTLEQRGIEFQSVSDYIDTKTPSGKLVFHVLGAVAEFEREMISERTILGLGAARRRGSLLGRPKSMSNEQIEEAHLLSVDHDWSITDIAARLNVGRTTLWRAMAQKSEALSP